MTLPAVLARLTITGLSTRKKDRGETSKVCSDNGVSEGSLEVYKKLFPGNTKIAELGQAARALRTKFRSPDMTLPWEEGRDSERIMPNHVVIEKAHEITDAIEKLHSLADKFSEDYSDHLKDAQARLGSKFSPSDYPTSPKDSFRAKFSIRPIPSHSAEFFDQAIRDAAADAVESGVKECKDALSGSVDRLIREEKFRGATIVERVERCEEILANPNDRFKESAFSRFEEISVCLRTMNIFQDQRLDEISQLLEDISTADAELIRTQRSYVEDVKARINRLKGLL